MAYVAKNRNARCVHQEGLRVAEEARRRARRVVVQHNNDGNALLGGGVDPNAPLPIDP